MINQNYFTKIKKNDYPVNFFVEKRVSKAARLFIIFVINFVK